MTIRPTSFSYRRTVTGALAAFLFFAVAENAFPAVDAAAPVPLKSQAEAYFASHDYDGFYDRLSRVLVEDAAGAGAEAYFYRALTRLEQIAYWKQTKNWEGVYDIGPTYRKGIAADLVKAGETAGADDPLRFRISFLCWRAAQEGEDEDAYAMFDDVVAAAEKAAGSQEGLLAVKDVADGIKELEDKFLSRRLYMVYAANLGASGMPAEEILENADAFLKEDNLYLAKSMYGIYLERIEDDLSRVRVLVEIAGRFAHPGGSEALDPVFAEDMYRKASGLKGLDAFGEEGMYRRAFNLERLKDYEAAVPVYESWLNAYGGVARERCAEVLFRIGILKAYGLLDRAGGEEALLRLIEDFPGTGLSVTARYELGCMAEWSGERDKAKALFTAARNEALDAGFAGDDETVALLDARLGELESEKPMAYPLSLFFDGVFKKDPAAPVAFHVDLTGAPARAVTGAPVRYLVATSNPMTGCMMPDFSYEWSGETGTVTNIPNTPAFDTSYKHADLKVVHAAVVGSAGLEGVGFDIVQVVPENKEAEDRK